MIYLDNSVVARPSPKAISAMMPFYNDLWGSPTVPHAMGNVLLSPMRKSYSTIYSFLGASPEDRFVLTSSGAEAINHVVMSGYLSVTMPTGRNHYLTLQSDDAPQILSMGRLENLGCVAKKVAQKGAGVVNKEIIADHITPRTALVSLSWANGLTGVVQPVGEISELCQERGILFHVDATHVLGKLYFTLPDVGADFLSFDGAPLHAPVGSGGLWIKTGIKAAPLLLGGNEQGGMRGGNFSVAHLAALAAAMEEAQGARDLLAIEGARLRDRLEKGVMREYPEAVPLFTDVERLPHVTAISFPGIPNEAMLHALHQKKVYASIGGGHMQNITYLLEGCSVDKRLAGTAVSFSLSRETTEEEIDRAVVLIGEAARTLRKNSRELL